MEDYKAWLQQGGIASPSQRDIVAGENQMRGSNMSSSPGGASRQSSGSAGNVAYMAATGNNKSGFLKKPLAMSLGSPKKAPSPKANYNQGKDELAY